MNLTLKSLILGTIIAITSSLYSAESGILFLKGTQSDKNFKLNATVKKGTWRYLPGGFMVTLNGVIDLYIKNLVQLKSV